MIRLLLLLCAGIFVTLQVGGQDRGQVRFGLMDVPEPVPTVAAQTAAAQAPATQPPVTQTAVAEPQAGAVSDATVTQVVFAPAQPLMTQAAEQAAETQPVVQAAAETATETNPEALGNTMYVTGRSVNVRSGPSTQDAVMGRLTRGEAVSVVWVEENGWARVRVEGDGVDGYMAMSFLADAP